MKRPVVLVSILFVLAILAVIVFSTLQLSQHKVKVCMQFNGRSNCGTASATSRDFAQRTATTNACAMIASGVTDSMACERSEPVSVTDIK